MDDESCPSSWGRARQVQEEVARFAAGQDPVNPDTLKTIGGTDAAYSGERACACVVVMEYESLGEKARATATSRVSFPYVPGYFAFREIPALLEALRLLSPLPDLLLVHGHGYAHPRRAGIATHLGVLLGVPTIGIAENLLGGMEAQAPENRDGATSPVVMDGEVVGSLLRPGVGRTPLCVSPGFRTTLRQATGIALRCTRDHRLPEPLYMADRCAGRFLKEAGTGD